MVGLTFEPESLEFRGVKPQVLHKQTLRYVFPAYLYMMRLCGGRGAGNGHLAYVDRKLRMRNLNSPVELARFPA